MEKQITVVKNPGCEHVEQSVIGRTIRGEYQDTIYAYNEGGEIVSQEKLPLCKNIITNGVSQYMAGLIQGTYLGGAVYMAVGTGSQAQSETITTLVAEYTRAQCSISFVDNTNAVSATPTNRLAFTVIFAKGAIVATLTEFGLFAGTQANLANGGLELDYVAHQPISLDATLSLSRTVYLSF